MKKKLNIFQKGVDKKTFFDHNTRIEINLNGIKEKKMLTLNLTTTATPTPAGLPAAGKLVSFVLGASDK